MADTIILKDKDGKEIKNLRILSVQSENEFNKIPTAEVKLIDGDTTKQEFEQLDSDHFQIGQKMSISIRVEGNMKTENEIFSGVVTGLALDISSSGSDGSTLQVNLRDEAFRMTSGRLSGIYSKKKDSQIIKELIQKYKLKAGHIEDTQVMHDQMVKNYVTDWDFMVSRAEANGQLIMVSNGAVSCIHPKIETHPVFSVEVGVSQEPVFDVQLQVNGEDQYTGVEAVAWDEYKKRMRQPVKGKYTLAQGDQDGKKIANAAGIDETRLIHPAAITPAELQSWSNAQVMKSLLSLVTGSITLRGRDGKVQVGQTIELKGVGNKNSGKNIITGVRHTCSETETWTAVIQVGMEADWFSSQHHIVDRQVSGLLPGVNGLQIGVVQSNEKNHDRVKVTIPAFDSKEVITARLASAYAGNGHGSFFRPEPGDEVVVGFLNDDPRQAIIVTALHNQVNQTPWALSEKNHKKGIFIRPGYQLLFDEEAERITLATPQKNEISIDDKQGKITLRDANDSEVEINKSGVMINTSGNFQVNAKGEVSINANKNVKIKGKKIDLI